jgi:putative tricarboxylic transport membrane protein
MKINDAIFGLVLVLFGTTVVVHVQDYPTIPGQQYGPAIFPGLVAAGLVVCGVLLVAGGLRQRKEEPWFVPGEWVRSRRHVLAFLSVVLGVVAYILLAELVGFVLVAPVLLFVWFVVFGVRLPVAAALAGIVTLAIWYAFYKLLRVPLPWGVLKDYAF